MVKKRRPVEKRAARKENRTNNTTNNKFVRTDRYNGLRADGFYKFHSTPSVVYHKDFKKSMEEHYKMKILSIDDFKGLCNRLLFCEFIMCSENQPSSNDSGLLFDFDFTKMQIECNPNRICLTNTQSSFLVFNRVKYVIEREESVLGRVFDIVCKGFCDDAEEFKYRIIAR